MGRLKTVVAALALVGVLCGQSDGDTPLRNKMRQKGDTITSDGTTPVRLPSCPDGQTRVADSTQALGSKCVVTVLASNAPLDVVSYGADRTGVNDSSAAFTNCMAANKGNCYIPAGTYKWTNPVTNTGPSGLIGAGIDAQCSSPPVAIRYYPTGNSTSALTITGQGGRYQGFALLQGNSQTSTNGIALGPGAFNTDIQDVATCNFTGRGMFMYAGTGGSVIYTTIINPISLYNAYGIELLGDQTNSGKVVNSTTIRGGRITQNTVENLKATNGVSEIKIDGTDLTAAAGTTNAVEVNAAGGTARTFIAEGFTVEGNVTNAFNLTGVNGVWLSGYVSTGATNPVTSSSTSGYFYDTRLSSLSTIGTPTTSFGQSKILNYQGVSSPIALSTNSVNVIWTYTVPANTLTAGRCLEVALGFVSDSAISATVELDYANPALQVGDGGGVTLATSNTRMEFQICATDSSHQQADKLFSVYTGNNPLPNAYFGPVAGTGDATQNQTLRFYVNPGANSGVHITPQFWRVTLL